MFLEKLLTGSRMMMLIGQKMGGHSTRAAAMGNIWCRLLSPVNAAGNAFSHVRLCAFLSSLLFALWLSKDLETLFSICSYTFRISRMSPSYIKGIGSSSRSQKQEGN